jgi:SAM-dependent methyltransferase
MDNVATGNVWKRVKRRIKWPLISLVASLPDPVQTMLFIPRIRKFGQRVPILKVIYTGCYRTHPIDRALGTDTGGIEPPEAIYGEGKSGGSFPYMGSQPSVVRSALQKLGDVRDHSFIDIGCGKGRPMIVATEFPFRQVVGYDLSERLVNVANRNARLVARDYPERVPMRAFAADALKLDFPSGKLVVYLFNPFGASIMTQLLSSLVAAYERGTIEAFWVVYLHPLCESVFDSSPLLERHYTASVPYVEEELGYDAVDRQEVRIWKTRLRM